jgi:ribonuclease-3
MGEPMASRLTDLFCEPDPDLRKIVDLFIIRYNAAYGISGSGNWDLTIEDWQRYEFLGNRVLNLIVAQQLFTLRNPVMGEREMTGIMGDVVSTHSLDAILKQYGEGSFSRLIPPGIEIRGPNEARVITGRFEAFLGALYCEYGLDEVVSLVTGIMKTSLRQYDASRNAIGILQEYAQKTFGSVPEYREFVREGLNPQPSFSYSVFVDGRLLGEGRAPQKELAKQTAAQKALEKLGMEAGKR